MSAQPASTADEREQGIEQDAIGFVAALPIGLASTALPRDFMPGEPAEELAATPAGRA